MENELVKPECEKCGRELHVNPVDKPNVDWVKVVCSNCGNVQNISMIQLAELNRG